MTKEELISELRKIRARQLEPRSFVDREADHSDADGLLLDYIGDPEVSAAYADIEKWYA